MSLCALWRFLMFQKKIQVCLFIALIVMFSCTSKKKVEVDDFATDIESSEDVSMDAELDGGTSESDLNLDEGTSSAPESTATTSEPVAPSTDSDELSLENELQAGSTDSENSSVSQAEPQENLKLDSTTTENVDPSANTLGEQLQKSSEPIAQQEAPLDAANDLTPVPLPITQEEPAPVAPAVQEPLKTAEAPQPQPEVVAPEPPVIEPANINQVQFKSNDSGGALIIQSDKPLEYTTRLNSSTNQVVIEVLNVKVPSHLKRPLATKDMTSSIGHIDIYQKARSSTARFVIQLRPQSEQPLVQPEGTSLMVIGTVIKPVEKIVEDPQKLATQSGQDMESGSSNKSDSNMDPSANVEINTDLSSEGIMNTLDMDDYLANNTKFYGKKISIETTDMDVRDVLKFIAEESGVNMLFDEDLSGTISLKLRKVPWDQAFVLVLKSKGLSYRRQGSVLRIAKTDKLVQEEKVALQLKESKVAVEPLIVKNFSINYADINELERKLNDFIASDTKDVKSKGRVTSDKRTNTMIVTETSTKLKQVEALIKALDTQPHQVMIEARVIEASETFGKSLGVNWGLNRGVAFSGSSRISTSVGQPWADPEPIKISPSFGYNSPQSASGSFTSSLWFGKLGALGDLDVQLALQESEDKVKILSTPRVTVLTNTQASINQSFKLAQGTKTTISGGTPVTETNFVDVGVKLSVTPQISNLGTVRMQIDVARTGVQPGATTNSRDMKTEVIVKSGDTTVIGGVFQSDVAVSKNGIPGLKDIPVLGTLFRGQNDSQTKTELMVFVTPKILDPISVTNLSATQPDSNSTESK